MPFFEYKARNARGELVEGVLESADSGGVATQLFNSGITPVEIKLTNKPVTDKQVGWWTRLTEKKVLPIDVQLFSRQIFSLLKAGVPIMRALAGLQASATNKSFARVLQDMRESLDAGRELSAAMRRHPGVFSPFYLSMVSVGEMTGRLEEIFLRLFDQLEFDREMRQRVKTALRYPIFVIVAMTAAMVVINIFVIPAFAKVFAGFNAELPLMTRILLNTSNFTISYWPLMLVAAIGSALLFSFYISTTNGRYKWDRLKLRMPLVGKIILKGSLARFARSFALSSRSGVPIIQGFNVVAQTVDNAYITARIEQMRDGVERGDSILHTATVAGVFTPVVLQMIAIGEETGQTGEMLSKLAEFYEAEVNRITANLATVIEPFLMLIIGGAVAFFAISMFQPIYGMMGTFSG